MWLGGRKYPYDPYYAAFSPRLSFAWNPKFENKSLAKIFGDGATVIRGGYGRIYGRINGDVQVLNPLLQPWPDPRDAVQICTEHRQQHYQPRCRFRHLHPNQL